MWKAVLFFLLLSPLFVGVCVCSGWVCIRAVILFFLESLGHFGTGGLRGTRGPPVLFWIVWPCLIWFGPFGWLVACHSRLSHAVRWFVDPTRSSDVVM